MFPYMDIKEKVKQIMLVYTKRVSKILSENREELQSCLKGSIWEATLKGKLPECVNLENTMDMVIKFITVYELAARGADVEENLARRTHQQVKSTLNIDTSLEWDRVRSDIESKIDKLAEQELVTYLIKKYGVIGTGEIVAKEPVGDKGLENEVKWIIYVAAIVLNKVVKDRVLNN